MSILNKLSPRFLKAINVNHYTMVPPDKVAIAGRFLFCLFISVFFFGCHPRPGTVQYGARLELPGTRTLRYMSPSEPPIIGALEEKIYFRFGDDKLSPVQLPKLQNNIKWLDNNPWTHIILEGHCDEVGASDFNMALGDRRAREVKAYLYENGVDPERVIMVVSYGESKPIDPAHTYDARRQNRRVEFKLR